MKTTCLDPAGWGEQIMRNCQGFAASMVLDGAHWQHHPDSRAFALARGSHCD
jgi:hypothetical protein